MKALSDTATEATPDIVLIDDDGVTAVFAYNANAMSAATKITASQGMSLDWDTDCPCLPDDTVGVAAVVLCPSHFTELEKLLSRAGLGVEVLPVWVLHSCSLNEPVS